MNWLLDIILVAFMAIIVIVYTKRGCRAVIDLVTMPLTFICTLVLGPAVGKGLFGDSMLDHVAKTIKDVIVSVLGEGEGLTVGDIINNESISKLLEGTGNKADVLRAFSSVTVADPEQLSALAESMAKKVSETLAAILGSVIVFVVVFILIKILKVVISGIVKLPVLKQANSILGFAVGAVTAFAFAWIICVAFSFVIEYGLIEKYNDVLSSLADNSYILRFFCNLSLVDFVNIGK